LFDVDNINQNTVPIPRQQEKKEESKGWNQGRLQIKEENGNERARQWESNTLFCKF
jgi:hypothetical protein